MLKFINLKKLTANTLLGIILVGGLVAESANQNAFASRPNRCNEHDNGHGNSTSIATLASGETVIVDGYDVTNPGDSKGKLKTILTAGSLSGNGMSVTYGGGDSELRPEEVQQVLDNLKEFYDCDADIVTLTGVVRDFQASHPDFEFNLTGNPTTLNKVRATTYQPADTSNTSLHWTTKPEGKNIVTTSLSVDGKPIYNSANTAVRTVQNETTFNQWYRDVPGVNVSAPLSITLEPIGNGMYEYSTSHFFPINDALYGPIKNDPSVTPPSVSSLEYLPWETKGYKNRNYHFTYELHTYFPYEGTGNETFTFTGDDDVWVYINGKRVIDLGGVHKGETATVTLNAAKAAELGLEAGKNYSLDFFFAERNFAESNFKFTTNLGLRNYQPD